MHVCMYVCMYIIMHQPYHFNCINNVLNIDDGETFDSTDEETILNAAYCLLFPGKCLDLSALLVAKKFRHRGNKEGAVSALKLLEKDGLGKLIPKTAHRGASTVSTAIIRTYKQ